MLEKEKIDCLAAIEVWRPSSCEALDSFFNHLNEIAPVRAVPQSVSFGRKLIRVDPPAIKCDLLGTRNFHALPFFQALNECRGFDQAVGSTGIKPGKSATELFDTKLTLFQIMVIHIGDLQFASSRWFQRPRDVHHLLVVEIEPDNCPAGGWILRLFDDAYDVAVRIEFHDAISFRILDTMAEHKRAIFQLPRPAQDVR